MYVKTGKQNAIDRGKNKSGRPRDWSRREQIHSEAAAKRIPPRSVNVEGRSRGIPDDAGD